MPSQPPSVTVVLPVRNAAQDIGRQLAALRRQTVSDFEVVVSDNGSTDATRDVVDEASHGLRLRIVDSSGTAGVAHARNIGLSHAAATKILFCDADDEVDPGWVGAMSEALDVDALVGGYLDVSRINSQTVGSWTSAPTREGLPVCMKYLPYAVGANLGVRHEVIDTVGVFDVSYRGGHEEVDFAWRAQEAGFTIGFAPGAVVHYRLRSSVRTAMRQRFWYGRSYAQLYSRFQSSVPSTPVKDELRNYSWIVRNLPREIRAGRLDPWLVKVAWVAGRLVGDVRYRVRCPL